MSAEGGTNGFDRSRLGWGVFALIVLAVVLFRPITQLLQPEPTGVKIVFLLLLGNLVTDLVLAWIDPRVRLE